MLDLVEIDSRLAARKELNTELIRPSCLMANFVQIKVWLLKAVLAEVAAYGGNLLDKVCGFRQSQQRPTKTTTLTVT